MTLLALTLSVGCPAPEADDSAVEADADKEFVVV